MGGRNGRMVYKFINQQNCEVEQWPARWAHNPKVGGSNPPLATNLK